MNYFYLAAFLFAYFEFCFVLPFLVFPSKKLSVNFEIQTDLKMKHPSLTSRIFEILAL